MESTIDQYLVIEAQSLQKASQIASGNFGIVYKGKWQGSIDVAIKELLIQSSMNEITNEFLQELNILQKLKHPNVVLLYGYCPSPMSLVMELMQQSLYGFLHSSQEIEWKLRYEICLQIVQGLQYIHELKVIHRDLKSSNILLDASYKVKITDFGLSRIKTESKSLSSVQQVGTTRWMAPELMTLRPKYSIQSDIYALGMVFWEIATREIPFKALNDQVVIHQVSHEEREQIPQECPEQFAQIIRRCWQQMPQSRLNIEVIKQSLIQLIEMPDVNPQMTSQEIRQFLSLFREQKIYIEQIKVSILNDKHLFEQTDILQQLEVMRDQTIEQKLLEVIKASKWSDKITQASGNAIIILNYLGFVFVNQDMRGVRIKGVDLREPCFVGCDFSNSSLQDIKIFNGEIRKCNLDKANISNISNIQLEQNNLFTGHTDVVSSVVISRESNYIISASYDSSIKIWNFQTGALLRTLTGHTNSVFSVVISPDSNFIVSASLDKTIKIWNFQTRTLLRILTGHTSSVRSLVISPDSNYIISASSEPSIKIWNINTGTLLRTLTGHTRPVNSVVISPDSNYIISASDDFSIRKWNIRRILDLAKQGQVDKVS